MIDLRSDTVTKPTAQMREAMFAAAVGDDVYGEDATVNELESLVAAYFGHEAAIFVPSGTMANQIAVRLHCRPGEELLAESTSHVILWEGGGAATLSGVSTQPIQGKYGLLSLADLEGSVRPEDIHSPQTRLLWLENTHNRGGGRVQPFDEVAALCQWARQQHLACHLDGARLWNAIVATGTPGPRWGQLFDTLSVCFSKGLGAPVGSALVGSSPLIQQARRYRKLFGGAMRQVGYLAAACRFAMEHHIQRLQDDHANAEFLAQAIRRTTRFNLEPETVDSNVVWMRVDPSFGTAKTVAKCFREQGVLVAPLGDQLIRFCTHLDVNQQQCEQVSQVIKDLGA